MPFEFKHLEIPEIILIIPKIFEDERGFFMETYKYSEFKKVGIKEQFVQDNHSKSTYGVLRGLHYQKNPRAQGKLVRCVKGKILDVAVDIRKGSPTFGKWISQLLTEENKYILYIPVGFAHGFVALSEKAEVLYKTSEEYHPEYETGIRWNDPELNIDWQIKNPIISEKDKNLPYLKNADINFYY